MIKQYNLIFKNYRKKLAEKFCIVYVQDVGPSISSAEQHAMTNVFIRCDMSAAEGNHFQNLLKYSEQQPNINCNTLN
jgi:hypothetical protein